MLTTCNNYYNLKINNLNYSIRPEDALVSPNSFHLARPLLIDSIETRLFF